MNNKIGNCNLNTWYTSSYKTFKVTGYDEKTVTMQEFDSANIRNVDLELFKNIQVTGLLDGNNVSDDFIDILVVVLSKIVDTYPYINQDLKGVLYVSKVTYPDIVNFKESIKFDQNLYEDFLKDNILHIGCNNDSDLFESLENIIPIPLYFKKIFNQLELWHGDNYTKQFISSLLVIKRFLDNTCEKVYGKRLSFVSLKKDDIQQRYDLLLDKLVEAQEDHNIEDEYFIKGKLDVFRWLLNIL